MKEKIPTTLFCSVTLQNYDDLDDLIELADSNDCELCIQTVYRTDNMSAEKFSEFSLSKKQVSEILSKTKKYRFVEAEGLFFSEKEISKELLDMRRHFEHLEGCPNSMFDLVISPDYRLRPAATTFSDMSEPILEKSILGVWQNNYKEFRQKYGECLDCKLNEICNGGV